MNSNSTSGVRDPRDDKKVDRLMCHPHTDNDFGLRWPPNTVKKSLAVYELFFFLVLSHPIGKGRKNAHSHRKRMRERRKFRMI